MRNFCTLTGHTEIENMKVGNTYTMDTKIRVRVQKLLFHDNVYRPLLCNCGNWDVRHLKSTMWGRPVVCHHTAKAMLLIVVSAAAHQPLITCLALSLAQFTSVFWLFCFGIWEWYQYKQATLVFRSNLLHCILKASWKQVYFAQWGIHGEFILDGGPLSCTGQTEPDTKPGTDTT